MHTDSVCLLGSSISYLLLGAQYWSNITKSSNFFIISWHRCSLISSLSSFPCLSFRSTSGKHVPLLSYNHYADVRIFQVRFPVNKGSTPPLKTVPLELSAGLYNSMALMSKFCHLNNECST